MQRKLYMIRHAKSSWANPLQSDFERPLNERGEGDAPMMGKRLKAMGQVPDLIISSLAKRAKQTARKIAAEVGYDVEKIVWVNKLYHCIPSVFEEVIFQTAPDVKSLYIVAHNPGITEFVNEVSPKFKIAHMPTCGVVGMELDCEEWNEFSVRDKQVFLFEYPKKEA